MSRHNTPIGARFGSWVVIDTAAPSCNRNVRVRCRCECGQAAPISVKKLLDGKSTRCRSCARKAGVASLLESRVSKARCASCMVSHKAGAACFRKAVAA